MTVVSPDKCIGARNVLVIALRQRGHEVPHSDQAPFMCFACPSLFPVVPLLLTVSLPGEPETAHAQGQDAGHFSPKNHPLAAYEACADLHAYT